MDGLIISLQIIHNETRLLKTISHLIPLPEDVKSYTRVADNNFYN